VDAIHPAQPHAGNHHSDRIVANHLGDPLLVIKLAASEDANSVNGLASMALSKKRLYEQLRDWRMLIRTTMRDV
jgi:hypothetical protein